MAVDYNILNSKKIDETSNIAIRDQILQIAVYDEFKAYEVYTKVIEKFGNINPFSNIKEAEAVHYSVLINLMQKYGVEVPQNDWENRVVIPNSVIECCELGVASEIQNIAMYNHLLNYAQDSDIIDVLYRLQAASFNNHLPAFRSCVINHYNSGNIPQNGEDMMAKMQEYQTMINDIMSGNIDETMISKLLPNINMQFIGGAGTGAVLAYLLNELISKSQIKE
ncbi:ferritin-like domain-containing protein [Arcobacter vandammei]|uniref:ferritin-like domain-containing protein n=1 Tax=Arcobacter vandammei TaxID=2782243 RepID=UPI0018E05EF0|nr:DUF2202 domain-containing protein [Arcobacter vandammei]